MFPLCLRHTIDLVSGDSFRSGADMQQVEVLIKGHIDVEWSGWLEGLAVTHTGDGDTLLRGQVPDQPSLYGLLNRLADLGMQLISVSIAGANERKVEGSQPRIE